MAVPPSTILRRRNKPHHKAALPSLEVARQTAKFARKHPLFSPFARKVSVANSHTYPHAGTVINSASQKISQIRQPETKASGPPEKVS
jgi:hypothetical protein